MSKKITQDDCINRFVAIHGDKYDYSRVVYNGTHTHVAIFCKTHQVDFQQTPSKHWQGQGCPKCIGRHRTQEEAINKLISVHGNEYDYSNVTFTKIHDHIEPICKQHGAFKIRYSKHESGQGCPVCRYVKSSNASRDTLADFIYKSELIHGKGRFDYSKSTYINNNTEIEITCDKGHRFWQLPSTHKSGSGCAICSGVNKKTTESFIAEAIALHGNKYNYDNSIYLGIFKTINIICPKHGIFSQVAKDHLEGCGCPECPTAISKPESSLSDYIKSLGFEVKTDIRLDGDRKLRFDCIVESKKMIFEFNGCWHHRFPRKEPMYHVNKRKYAEQLGYEMYSIWEDDFLLKNARIKELINRKLLGCNNKIMARKTKVEMIGRKSAALFHEQYHIQDFTITKPTEHYALFANDGEMLAAISFDKSGVLHRYTIKSNITIIGGMAKLIAEFRRNNGNIDITTYCDRDFFNGNLYLACGFIKVSESKQLTYLAKGERVRREKFMKHKLPLLFPDVDMSKTESQICAENGVYACYNSGIDKYVLFSNESTAMAA